MGYPVITRLGINQFWYKHWYSDNNKAVNIQQDKIFTDLILMYLNYGLTYYNNIFFHEYFFSKHSKKDRLLNLTHKNKYYRRYFYTNTLLTIEHTYLLRKHSGEYFPMRMWHIKYNNWLVITFNCFKPLKKKKSRKIISKEASSVSSFSNYHTTSLNRFKILYLYLKFRYAKVSNYFF